MWTRLFVIDFYVHVFARCCNGLRADVKHEKSKHEMKLNRIVNVLTRQWGSSDTNEVQHRSTIYLSADAPLLTRDRWNKD